MSPQRDPLPVTTIAWRIAHLAGWTEVYGDWVFGEAKRRITDVEVHGGAVASVAWLTSVQQRFLELMQDVDDARLAELRPSHWTPTLPVARHVGDLLVDHIHHGAEIGLLRDIRRGRARVQPLPEP